MNENSENDMNTGPSSLPRIPCSDEAEVTHMELQVLNVKRTAFMCIC